jgi:hypothetical protein
MSDFWKLPQQTSDFRIAYILLFKVSNPFKTIPFNF